MSSETDGLKRTACVAVFDSSEWDDPDLYAERLAYLIGRKLCRPGAASAERIRLTTSQGVPSAGSMAVFVSEGDRVAGDLIAYGYIRASRDAR